VDTGTAGFQPALTVQRHHLERSLCLNILQTTPFDKRSAGRVHRDGGGEGGLARVPIE